MSEIAGYIIAFGAGLALAFLIWFVWRLFGTRLHENPAEIRRRLLKGAYEVLNEKWASAVREFSAVAKADPSQEDAYFVLGKLFRKMGDHRRAVRIHEGLVARHESDEAVREKAMFELAEDYAAAGLHTRSLSTFEELCELSPRWAEPLERLRDIAVQCGRWVCAADSIRRLEGLSGDRHDELMARVLLERSLELLEQGELKRAWRYIKEARGRAPLTSLLYVATARYEAARGKAKRAVRALVEGLDAEPGDARLFFTELEKLEASADQPDLFEELKSEWLARGLPGAE